MDYQIIISLINLIVFEVIPGIDNVILISISAKISKLKPVG